MQTGAGSYRRSLRVLVGVAANLGKACTPLKSHIGGQSVGVSVGRSGNADGSNDVSYVSLRVSLLRRASGFIAQLRSLGRLLWLLSSTNPTLSSELASQVKVACMQDILAAFWGSDLRDQLAPPQGGTSRSSSNYWFRSVTFSRRASLPDGLVVQECCPSGVRAPLRTHGIHVLSFGQLASWSRGHGQAKRLKSAPSCVLASACPRWSVRECAVSLRRSRI